MLAKFMRFMAKVIAAPMALVLALVSALCSFLLAVSGIFLGVVSGLVVTGAVVLFIIGEPVGGAAFLVVAFIVSPYGLPALAGRLVRLLDNASHALRGFIFG